MQSMAVVLGQPEQLELKEIPLDPVGEDDIVVETEWSGISTGTEKLLWSGEMPEFPGMGYPLVPGYETVGRIVETGPGAELEVGERVFVPGSRCFGEIRGLFGGAASRLIVPENRVLAVGDAMGEDAVLLALAATAHHAIAKQDAVLPQLVVGHGILGRLLARLTIAMNGEPPLVWETDPVRADGSDSYGVVHPDDDARRDYAAIYDVSGDSDILDSLISRLAPGGEIVLTGFYRMPLSFAFPPAFMREARIRVAAEWAPQDLVAVKRLIDSGDLSLDGLITHRSQAADADAAYRTAFGDPSCLKMILDWRNAA